MPTQAEYDRLYLTTAHNVAKLSKAVRLKVGAILVGNDSIVSLGYNGTPRGLSNRCEEQLPDGGLRTLGVVVHAEHNAILKLVGKTFVYPSGLIMYCTDSCCLQCASMMHQTGIISEFVYDREYRDTSGLDLLRQVGIKVRQIRLIAA